MEQKVPRHSFDCRPALGVGKESLVLGAHWVDSRKYRTNCGMVQRVPRRSSDCRCVSEVGEVVRILIAPSTHCWSRSPKRQVVLVVLPKSLDVADILCITASKNRYRSAEVVVTRSQVSVALVGSRP
jgi:hypothetical protein